MGLAVARLSGLHFVDASENSTLGYYALLTINGGLMGALCGWVVAIHEWFPRALLWNGAICLVFVFVVSQTWYISWEALNHPFVTAAFFLNFASSALVFAFLMTSLLQFSWHRRAAMLLCVPLVMFPLSMGFGFAPFLDVAPAGIVRMALFVALLASGVGLLADGDVQAILLAFAITGFVTVIQSTALLAQTLLEAEVEPSLGVHVSYGIYLVMYGGFIGVNGGFGAMVARLLEKGTRRLTVRHRG